MNNVKKNEQLGINYSTASNRLVKDLLFKFIVDSGNDICYHCGEKLTRDDFSIEHKIPWLDSANPIELFFALDNIAFSHLYCNVSAARKPHKLTPEEREAKRLTIYPNCRGTTATTTTLHIGRRKIGGNEVVS